MKAIFNNVLYTITGDYGDGVILDNVLHVPYSNENLVCEPTDGDIEALPNKYPVYERPDVELCDPGLYLALFHGSPGTNPDERELADWGHNGPMIGPLQYVHSTYCSDVKFQFVSIEAARRYAPFMPDLKLINDDDLDSELKIIGDCLEFNGSLYGDWTVSNFPEVPNGKP